VVFVFARELRVEDVLAMSQPTLCEEYSRLLKSYPVPCRVNISWMLSGGVPIEMVLDELDVADRSLTRLLIRAQEHAIVCQRGGASKNRALQQG
jgi:hypothetical protein